MMEAYLQRETRQQLHGKDTATDFVTLHEHVRFGTPQRNHQDLKSHLSTVRWADDMSDSQLSKLLPKSGKDHCVTSTAPRERNKLKSCLEGPSARLAGDSTYCAEYDAIL